MSPIRSKPSQRMLSAVPVHASLVCLALVFTAVDARSEGGPTVSEVTLSGTGVFINGNDDQFRARHGIPPDFTGGVESLYMEWLWGEDGSIRLDGRGIVDASDYLARLRLDQPDKGYISTGYREFRTWYDGTGGFFPQNAAIFSFFDEDLQLDRAEGWFEAGLRAPGVPQLTFRFTHLAREGQKSSTIWGDTTLTGGFGTRSIVPSFWNVDERRNIVDIDAAHDVAGSRLGAGFSYERTDIDNGLNQRRNPTQASDRFVTQRSSATSDLYNLHAFTTTPLVEDRLTLSTAYSYSTLDNHIGGSRIYGVSFDSGYDPAYPTRQPFDTGFFDLGGRTELDQHVGTATLQGRPFEGFQATAAVRVEQSDVSGASSFVATNVGFPPAFATSEDDFAAESDADTTAVSESVDLRYTAIDNWVFYVRGLWEQSDGDLTERSVDVGTGAVEVERDTDIELFAQKYVAGFTWYPTRGVNLAARYRYENNKYDFDHGLDSTDNTAGSDRMPAFITKHDSETNAGDFRITWSLLDNLRLTGRYDIAYTDYEQDSAMLASIRSAKVRSHAAGANASWSPTTASYLQANFNYVRSRTETPAAELSGAAAGLIDDEFENDYWTASLVTGIALTERTDLRAQYFYFRADNYDNDSATTQPFGSDAEEHGAALTLAHQLTDNLRWRLGYAFFTNDEELHGGANDYDASLVTTSVDLMF